MDLSKITNIRGRYGNYKRGYKLNDNTIFVAFKRDNNRYMSNYSRFFNRNRNIRRFNNYRRGFGPNSFQRQTRPMRNNVRGREQLISSDDSSVLVYVIPTDEEVMIALDTMELIS